MVATAVPSTRRFSNCARPSFLSLKKMGCHARFNLSVEGNSVECLAAFARSRRPLGNSRRRRTPIRCRQPHCVQPSVVSNLVALAFRAAENLG